MAVVAHALEAVVNPTKDGTLLRTTATLQLLQNCEDIYSGLLQQPMGKVFVISDAAAGEQLGNDSTLGFYRYSTIENTANKRKIDDCVMMVVTASIYGHPI